MYSRVEDQHLDAIRLGKQLEYERFHTMAENEEEEEGDEHYTLPSSFTGSAKYYASKVADSLALA